MIDNHIKYEADLVLDQMFEVWEAYKKWQENPTTRDYYFSIVNQEDIITSHLMIDQDSLCQAILLRRNDQVSQLAVRLFKLKAFL